MEKLPRASICRTNVLMMASRMVHSLRRAKFIMKLMVGFKESFDTMLKAGFHIYRTLLTQN